MGLHQYPELPEIVHSQQVPRGCQFFWSRTSFNSKDIKDSKLNKLSLTILPMYIFHSILWLTCVSDQLECSTSDHKLEVTILFCIQICEFGLNEPALRGEQPLSVLKVWILEHVKLEHGNFIKVLLYCETSWVGNQQLLLSWYTSMSVLTSPNCNNYCFQYCLYQTRSYFFIFISAFPTLSLRTRMVFHWFNSPITQQCLAHST